ncbi:MAG: amidohydrolase family protein [Armatimonadota bacterium]
MDIREIDKIVYKDKLESWLPKRIIDFHVHINLPEHYGAIAPERSELIWAMEIATSFSWDEMWEAYKLLFPMQDVEALVFGGVYQEVDIPANNEYIRQGIGDSKNKAYGLMVTRPEWDASVLRDGMAAGFKGIKPYPDLAPQGMNDASIYDFLPHAHLSVMNELGGIIVLHLPKPGRIADPANISELLEISNKYPNIKMVVAHIGRAYCLPTAEKHLDNFKDIPGIYFDIAANLNNDVFRYALDVVGPYRLIFGSDLPVMLMRGVREHVGGKYINFSDGDYTWNVNRKCAADESAYTFYIYEELIALKQAVDVAGLGSDAIQQIMYSNAARLLDII